MKKISLILIFVLLLCFGCGSTATAFAVTANDSVEYTNVMDDLTKDPTFDASKYPIDYADGKLELLTLAESVNNELFVYVYSPAILRAASINISLVEKDVDYKVYGLTLINAHDGFFKYKVDGLTVSSDATRYYEISSISRRFVPAYDEELDNGNVVSMTPFKVGKAFTFTGSGSTLSVSFKDVEVITVTDKYVGFIRYPDGGIFSTNTGCDVHHVAFSTDKRMDKLLEVDVYYTYQSYRFEHYNVGVDKNDFSTPDEKYVNVKSSEDFSYSGSGWFSFDYKWQSIEKASDFAKNLNDQEVYNAMGLHSTVSVPLDDPSLITSKDWVFRFAITDYDKSEYPSYDYDGFTIVEGTIISDVSILRLAFETDGVPYNLGVVDNMQSKPVDPDSGEPEPDNPGGVDTDTTFDPDEFFDSLTSSSERFFDKLKTIGFWVFGAVVLFLGWKVLRWVVDFLRGK